jgi:hypothetical protein
VRLLLALLVWHGGPPDCSPEPGRHAEPISGSVSRGETFNRRLASGWIFRLRAVELGWTIEVTTTGREEEDLARLTPPWHFVPNPRDLEGWHFRNASNTGPNDGSVNAPGELREFIFSPAVGREIEYDGSATAEALVETVGSFGRGWLFVESYRLTPPQSGTRAAFETLRFLACLTWPDR